MWSFLTLIYFQLKKSKKYCYVKGKDLMMCICRRHGLHQKIYLTVRSSQNIIQPFTNLFLSLLLKFEFQLFTSLLLLLEIIVWKCSSATTATVGTEIDMQPLFNNLETMLVDNPIISKWLIGEDQIANRSDSEVIRRPRFVGHTMNVAASPNSIHGAFGRMNPAA